MHPKFKRVYATKWKQGTNAKTPYTRKLDLLNSTIRETWSPKTIQIGCRDNAALDIISQKKIVGKNQMEIIFLMVQNIMKIVSN